MPTNPSPSSEPASSPTASTSTSPSSSTTPSTWESKHVLQLISLWSEYQERFNSPKHKKKAVWQNIVEVPNVNGCPATWIQAESKWKNLTKRYRDTVDHNNASGNGRRTCQFFEELSDIYGYRPNVNSVVTMSTITPPKRKADEIENNENNATTKQAPTKRHKSCLRKSSTQADLLISTMNRIHSEQKEMEQNKLETAEKMHREKIELFTQFIDFLKSISC